MSRLKELRLHGFKTFADPTTFVFEPGVNAVIGPNGSGKSNMADAVRWVLGEQSNRSLRTRRADDVIFAGSQSRRPQGMAEAILTLDNADGWLPIEFAEVSVGRRSYRSGESEYLINGARARLRDVVELLGEGRLGANELVVVGQGTVDAALSLRPEERRQLFEEAAGVKNLQVRKNESLARLGRARDNLTRVNDLAGELRPQVRRLALQARHATEHEALVSRARALVVESHRRREATERSALGEARRQAAAAEAALEAYRDEQKAGRDALEAAERRYWEADSAARAAAERRESTREATIRAESRLDALKLRRAELEAALERASAELAGLRRQEPALEAEPDLDSVLTRAAEAERAWRAAVDALAAADRELLDAEHELADVRRRQSGRIAAAARDAEERARAEARRDRLLRELATAREARAAAQAASEPARVALEDAQRRLATAEQRLREASTTVAALQPKADEARRRSAELAERVGVLRSELAALQERAEPAARLGSMLAAAGWQSLLDALDAPEEAWTAIEAVVGGELEHALLWRDGQIAERLAQARGAARLLAAAGSATRAPDVEASRPIALAAVGAERTLADWVGGAAVPDIFRRTAVAPDVGRLLAGWRRLPPGWFAVTSDGDLADARGLVVLRGRADPPGGLAARQHARRRELSEALSALEAEQEAAAAAAAAAFGRLVEAQRARDETRREVEAAERAARERRAEMQAVEDRLARAARLHDELRSELNAAVPDTGARSVASDPEVADEDQLAVLEARAAAARRARDEAAAARDAARGAWEAVRSAAEKAEASRADRRRQSALREAREAQLMAALPEHQRSLSALAEQVTAVDAELAAARAADAETAEQRAAADAERDRLRGELLELERGRGGAASRLAELERAAQLSAIAASRHEDALAAIGRERQLALESLPQPTRRDAEAGAGAQPDAPEATEAEVLVELAGIDDAALDDELRRVRRTLAQIGSVNPFAVEEHRELAQRLDELTSQDDDLRGAIASTEELIARLDAEINEKFATAFAAIGARFDEYCRLLFAGGSASLQLGDGEDGEAPGGIEIVVRPPGKRLQRLAMLSGGERALTGVALLFAMLSVNPVPFCILDEVDAALDEANIGRFAQALRRLAESIDFVVITHNRATIEVADTIYGVTMTDAAVSRVLSLRLSDLPAEVSA